MKQPRPHQAEAVLNALSHFALHDRGQLVMACGSGKTLTSLWIAESLKNQNIIVSLPSLQLQAQSLGTWLIESKDFNYNTLVVGSDMSIKSTYGVDVTTNEDDIISFLKKDGKKLLLTTYQSADVLINACIATNTVFDFGIIDEAHRTVGKKAKHFGKILDDANGIVIKKRLFMTATPRFFESESSDTVTSMDDVSIYGKVVYRLPTEEAIKKGILCDYKVIVLWCNDGDLEKYISSNRESKLSKDSSSIRAKNKYFALASAMKVAIKKYGIRRAITFHKSIDLAKSFRELLHHENPNYGVYHLDSSLNHTQRTEVIENFKKEEVGIITNPKVLLEGLDIPEIDAVGFIDAKKSGFEVIQAIGRALRRYESKSMGYVLLPIFVNEKGVINEKDFLDIAASFSAMGMDDSRVKEYFSSECFAKKRETLDSDIVGHVMMKNVPVAPMENLREKIGIRVWNRLRVQNFMSYQEAQALMVSHSKVHGINTSIKFKNWARETQDFGVKFPKNMPKDPSAYYAEHWENWAVFLDIKPRFDIMSFEECLEVMKNISALGIDSIPKLENWIKGEFTDLPAAPSRFPASVTKTYKEQIQALPNKLDDFFYRKPKQQLCSYEEAKAWVQSKGIHNRESFYKTERPEWVTSNPNKFYKEEWQGWSDFLGKKQSKNINYVTYEEAKKWVHAHISPTVNSFSAWQSYLRGEFLDLPTLPDNHRRNPAKYDNWEGWDKFFGKDTYLIKKRDDNERIPVSFLKSLLENDNYNKEEVEKTLIYVENQYSENPKTRKELGLTNFAYSYFHSKYLHLYRQTLT